MPTEMIPGNPVPESEIGSRALRQSQSSRYESLTAWRGFACLLIVVYHSIFFGYERPVPAGQFFVFNVLRQCWIGVPIFFVISGYCITASAEAFRRHPLPVKKFFWRRFRRIFPPYWIWFGIMAISVYWVETSLAPGYFPKANVIPPQEMTTWQWIGNLSLTEIWRANFVGGSLWRFWGPCWTLCYEEQFYLIIGLILLVARRFFFGATAVVSLVVIAGLLLLPGYGAKIQGTFLDGQWLTFAAGILVYYILNYTPSQRQDWYGLPLIAGTIYLVAAPRQASYLDGKWVMALTAIAAYGIWKYAAPRRRWYLFVPLALGLVYAFIERKSLFRAREPELGEHYMVAFLFAVLIIALKKWDDSITRSAVLAPLRFCGKMCYSLYLVHWPVVTIVGHAFDVLGVTNPAAILLVTVPCCIAAALLVGRVFHLLVERRFWNLGIDNPEPKTNQAPQLQPI